MAEIIDLDFYRKFRVALPLRQEKLEEVQAQAEAKADAQADKLASKSKSLRRYRKHRKSLKRPIYRNHPNIQD